ncbi:MAG: hypothetical protein EA412_01325 [Chitinophagaceae bacterium]|nr:MAG: hypothetical protein EA412_01325 [Chitinophagaceae bacterium]
MRFKFYTKILLTLLLISVFFTKTTEASHAVGGDLSYTCLGNNQYEITFTYYNDCDGISAPASPNVNISSASCGQSFNQSLSMQPPPGSPPGTPAGGQEVPFLCQAQSSQSACNNGPLPGLELYTYTAIITLPQECDDWVITYSLCCRNSQITNLQNPAGAQFYIETNLDNTNGLCNNSPVFTGTALQYACANQLNNLNFGAVDLDGDSLVFSLVNPMTNGGNPINYSDPSFSPTNPMDLIGPLVFNTQTGQISFTPDGTQVAVLTIRVDEYRNGELIGSTIRDIQIFVVPCNTIPNVSPIVDLQGGAQLDSTVVETCPDGLISFDIIASTPDTAVTIDIVTNVGSAIPDADFQITGSGNGPIVGTFTWQPSALDVGIHFFTVTVTDDACPYPGQATFSYQINVLPGTFAGPDLFYCDAGGPVQLQAIGGSSFTWTPVDGLSDPNIPNPTASPNQTTTYIVESNLNPICKNRDTVTVFVVDDFTYTISDDDSICQFNSTMLNVNPDPAFGPYGISWSPSNGLNTTSGANVIANPFETTTYEVEMVSDDGCRIVDSVSVILLGVAPNVIAIADPDTICPGGAVQLDVAGSSGLCGEFNAPCLTTPDEFTVGTGTSANTGNTYPAIYGNWFWGNRTQMLYTAAELQALGVNPGVITSLSFQVATLGGQTTLNNFRIRMGCVTSMNTLTTWQTGLTQVYDPKTVNVVNGWNTHVFDTNYEWDGVSDLIVEVCFNNSSFTSQNTQNFFTTTPTNSVIWYRADNANVCTNNAITGSSNQRPNTRFGVCLFQTTGMDITWLPSNLVSDSSISNPIAFPTETTTFEVLVDDGGCVGNSFVTVVTDQTVEVEASPDTSFCNLDPIQLTSNVIGTPSPVLLSCGANNTVCPNPAAPVEMGTVSGGNVSNVTSPFKGDDTDGRIQIIYTAAELQNEGLSTGVISEIALRIAFKNSTAPFENFEIKMGCTSQSSFNNDFIGGLDLVYSNSAYSTVSGWNNFQLDNTFDWDGTSNIVIEICFSNPNFDFTDIINYTPGPANSVIYTSQLFAPGGGCAMPFNLASGGQSSDRPNMRFVSCPPPPGDFVYTWSPADNLDSANVESPIFTPPAPGTYTYVLTVSDGICEDTDTVTISVAEPIDIDLSYFYNDCEDTVANVVVNFLSGVAPYDIVWNTGQTANGVTSDTLFNVPPGIYSVTVNDAVNCDVYTDSITVGLPSLVDVTLSKVDPTCFGLEDGIVSVTATGGTAPYNITWSDGTVGDTVLFNQGAGVISVFITDAAGCPGTDTIELVEPDEIITDISFTDVSCYNGDDGSITVNSVVGGVDPYDFQWIVGSSSTDPSISGLTAGTYILQTQDANNCQTFDTIVLTQPDSFTISVSSVDASCFSATDGSASANVGGDIVNYSFEWNTTPVQATPEATNIGPGTYTVSVTDSVGCVQTEQVTVGSPPEIEVDIQTQNVSCFGGSDGSISATVTAGGTGPFTFEWDNNEVGETITDLEAGSYNLIVTDAQGCEAFVNDIILTAPDALDLAVSTTDLTCYGAGDGSAEIQISGGTAPYTTNWSDGQSGNTASGLQAGSFMAVVIDDNGCIDSISFVIDEPDLFELTSLEGQQTSCPNTDDGVISIDVTGGVAPYTYEVSDIGTFNTPEIGNIPAGSYVVTVTDDNNCSVTGNVDITEPPVVSILFTEDMIEYALGSDPVQITSEIIPDGNYTYTWSPLEGLSCSDCQEPMANPLVTTTYQLTVFDENGCPFTNSILIEVENPLILYVPNAFSPDGDGVNDIFMVYGVSIESIDLRVFDRWGALVFQTNDINQGWDGTFQGQDMNPGVYAYYVEATYIDGQQRIKKGSVTLIR